MNILDEIVSKKKTRVNEAKSKVPIEDIQNQLVKISSLKSNFKKRLENQKQSIIAEIKKIYDPELPVNIYDLGLIYDVQVNEKKAKIKMTLTTPNCPVAESLPKEVKDGAMQVDEIEDVDLELVWDPPWTKEMMSDAAKLELNL